MTWAPTNLLLRLYRNHKEVRTVLHDEYNIPRDAVNSIDKRKTDDGESAYQVQFQEEYVNDNLISKFCEYNDTYMCERDNGRMNIYRVGAKSDLLVGNIENNTHYTVTVEYFDEDKIRSESTSKLIMISEFFNYRTQGDFRFVGG